MNYEWQDDFLVPVIETDSGELLDVLEAAEIFEELGDENDN
jgi:hypothetical protein